MKARLKSKPEVTGSTSDFNTHAMFEVIFYFDPSPGSPGGDCDSVFGRDVEVFIEAKQQWMDLGEALRSHDVINDNFASHFFEPRNTEDRQRGYTL
jgi:hypothetical protein